MSQVLNIPSFTWQKLLDVCCGFSVKASNVLGKLRWWSCLEEQARENITYVDNSDLILWLV